MLGLRTHKIGPTDVSIVLIIEVLLNLRHPHRKTVDDHMGVERFENVS